MKTICKQTIVISIILLLVGVSVSSAISVDTKSTISNNESEDCRECKEVSDADLIRVERLLNRVEVYSKLLSVLSWHNPELKEVNEELSNLISRLDTLDLKDLVCGTIFFLWWFFFGMAEYYYELQIFHYNKNHFFRALMYQSLNRLCIVIYIGFQYLFFMFDCEILL